MEAWCHLHLDLGKKEQRVMEKKKRERKQKIFIQFSHLHTRTRSQGYKLLISKEPAGYRATESGEGTGRAAPEPRGTRTALPIAQPRLQLCLQQQHLVREEVL